MNEYDLGITFYRLSFQPIEDLNHFLVFMNDLKLCHHCIIGRINITYDLWRVNSVLNKVKETG